MREKRVCDGTEICVVFKLVVPLEASCRNEVEVFLTVSQA